MSPSSGCSRIYLRRLITEQHDNSDLNVLSGQIAFLFHITLIKNLNTETINNKITGRRRKKTPEESIQIAVITGLEPG